MAKVSKPHWDCKLLFQSGKKTAKALISTVIIPYLSLMRTIFLASLALLFAGSMAAQSDYPQDYFRSPLSIPLISSGTFGELRGNHFHSGLDIKTQGRIGQAVLAAAEGDIVRIKVSPYGFGKALYLRHPNGYTTVYAHLDSFHPDIEAWVIAEMRRKQSNEVDLFPPAGKFSFAQGEEIAKSGNSGGSGGPHLHFEVRDTRTEKIINPLLFGFDVADSRPPEIGPLQVYYFSDKGVPTGQKEYRSIKIEGSQYGLVGEGIVEASGALSFGLYSIDRQDGAYNKNGVFDLKLFVGEELHHRFNMETFAFAETRFINAHIDYGLKACCNRSSHRLFREPGNALSVYPNKAEAGHLHFDRDTVVPIRIEAADVAGNVSVLQFDLHYRAQAGLSEPEVSSELAGENQQQLYFNQADIIQGTNYELAYKQGSFYRDYTIQVESEDLGEAYSRLFTFGSREVPVHRYFDLKLRATHLPKGLNPSKLFIASYKDGKYDDYEGGYYANGWVTCRTRQLGSFAILADTTAPTASLINYKSRGSIPETLQIRVGDDLSGVEEYNAWVDGVWVPIYYDAKTRRLLLNTTYWPEKEGLKYVLKLVLEDDKKNRSEQNWDLFIP